MHKIFLMLNFIHNFLNHAWEWVVDYRMWAVAYYVVIGAIGIPAYLTIIWHLSFDRLTRIRQEEQKNYFSFILRLSLSIIFLLIVLSPLAFWKTIILAKAFEVVGLFSGGVTTGFPLGYAIITTSWATCSTISVTITKLLIYKYLGIWIRAEHSRSILGWEESLKNFRTAYSSHTDAFKHIEDAAQQGASRLYVRMHRYVYILLALMAFLSYSVYFYYLWHIFEGWEQHLNDAIALAFEPDPVMHGPEEAPKSRLVEWTLKAIVVIAFILIFGGENVM